MCGFGYGIRIRQIESLHVAIRNASAHKTHDQFTGMMLIHGVSPQVSRGTDDYTNRQLFLIKYILCIGVLPSGDKICDNKNNNPYRHCEVSVLFFVLLFTSWILHTFGCNFFTQCLDLLSTAENNLKNIQLFYSENV